MKVFQDVFTNDELMSDIFKFTLAHDDVIMKVKSRLTTKDNCANVDVGNYLIIKFSNLIKKNHFLSLLNQKILIN